MALKEKLNNINKATRNISMGQIAEELGYSRQAASRYPYIKLISRLIKYVSIFGFTLMLENDKGDKNRKCRTDDGKKSERSRAQCINEHKNLPQINPSYQ